MVTFLPPCAESSESASRATKVYRSLAMATIARQVSRVHMAITVSNFLKLSLIICAPATECGGVMSSEVMRSGTTSCARPRVGGK
jgi:hypothetical protein